jgi:tetratricopeptide (TPR) repeat protein
VDAYFNKLSGSFSSDPVLAARVLFCLGTVYFELNKVKEAIAVFARAFEGAGDAPVPAAYFERYGDLLTTDKNYEAAIDVYLKMEARFKEDPQTQANAVWGLGNAYLQTGAAFWEANQSDKAQEYFDKARVQFDRLQKEFAWHKHAADAQFGIGYIAERQNRCDEAIKIYEEVAARLKGEARIRSLLGLGRCQEKKGDCKSAVDNFVKVAVFYEKYEEFACEALWRAGQCYEKLGPAERDKAIQQYRELVQKYARCKFFEEAKKRLGELTGTQPTAQK